MWYVILVVICSIIAAWAPQYLLPIMAVPFLIPILLLMASNKWDENLFIMILGPILFFLPIMSRSSTAAFHLLFPHIPSSHLMVEIKKRNRGICKLCE